jgi:hypothetical protein
MPNYSASGGPHRGLLRHFQIPIAETDALLRGLVQHVPSTRLRTGLSRRCYFADVTAT